jgi:DNA-binding transcriptional MerR regulator
MRATEGAGSRRYRDYDDDTLERLSIIALGKRLGFSLAEMAAPLDRLLSDDLTRVERAAFLAEQVRAIDARIADLQAAREELVAIVARPEKDYVDARLKELGLWVG